MWINLIFWSGPIQDGPTWWMAWVLCRFCNGICQHLVVSYFERFSEMGLAHCPCRPWIGVLIALVGPKSYSFSAQLLKYRPISGSSVNTQPNFRNTGPYPAQARHHMGSKWLVWPSQPETSQARFHSLVNKVGPCRARLSFTCWGKSGTKLQAVLVWAGANWVQTSS